MKKNLEILLVDDVGTTREILKNSLKSLDELQTELLRNTQYLQAADAASAKHIFEASQPPLIYLDIELPDKNGIELLKEIKASAPNTFIVMVSGDNTLDNVKACITAGANGFIVKPFNVDKVHESILNFFKHLANLQNR